MHYYQKFELMWIILVIKYWVDYLQAIKLLTLKLLWEPAGFDVPLNCLQAIELLNSQVVVKES